MKRALVSVLLLTTTVCSAQLTRETTNASWNYQNLSVENWDGRNWIIAGATEINPSTGLLCPIFKFTDPNLVPIGPAPLPTYRTVFSTNKVLMDFTVNQTAGHIIMTGTDPLNSTGAPLNMFITVINAPNGAVISSIQLPFTGFSLIPHQIIYSPTNNQYVVVGTKYSGLMTTANFATVSKTGFVLIVNAATLATVNFIETNTPSVTGGNDSDMLESVTELPGGAGYFAGGSANGFATPAEQNVMVMTVVGGTWTPGPSCVMDNTTSRSVVSSVMHNPATNQIIVLDNNSSFGTYELMKFTAGATPVFPAVRHLLNTCIPTGTITNGFRLQQDAASTQIIVAGYAWVPGSTGLRPFQTTTNPNLVPFINAKAFQSSNNSPLTGYFNESGNPVFINTPDILSYHRNSNRTFLVNPNTNFGFDMIRSTATATLGCEVGCQFTTVSAQWPVAINGVAYTQSLPTLPTLPAGFATRVIANTILCTSSPLAPISEEPVEGRDFGVNLFPNPAINNLEINAEIAIEEAVVYDMKGNKVLSAVNEQNVLGIRMLDVSMLKSGVYIISLKDVNGTLYRERFVKE